jgi:hypothetical protein
MTYAPSDLAAVRSYLLGAGLGLDGSAVGIVGDAAHAASGGYHEGRDDLVAAGRLGYDYSVVESPRDGAPTNAASALDIGSFDATAGGRRVTLRSLSLAVVALCVAGDPRARDIREVIYTPDGVTVKRWDRLGKRTSGDSSHLYHTHISCFRDSEGRRAGGDNVLGLLKSIIEGTGMSNIVTGTDIVTALADGSTAGGLSNDGHSRPNNIAQVRAELAVVRAEAAAAAAAAEKRDAAMLAAVQALAAGGTSIDTAAVLDAIHQEGATESQTVAALTARIAHLEMALAAAASAEASALAQPTA